MSYVTRSKKRLDYKELNETGCRVEKTLDSVNSDNTVANPKAFQASPISSLSLQLSNLQFTEMETKKDNFQAGLAAGDDSTEEMIKLECKFSILLEEVEDHIDENPINNCTVSIEDIDSCIEKIEKLRSELRIVNRVIISNLRTDEYTTSFGPRYDKSMGEVKEYIIQAKERKQAIRKQEKDVLQNESIRKSEKDAEVASQKKRAAEFLVTEVFRLISELHTEFSKDRNNEVSNEEIARRKDNLSSNLVKLNQLSITFQRCLETIPESYDQKEETIEKMKSEYEQLIKEKELHEKFVQEEAIERELDKEKTFQISSVNIKLEKFKDYDSEIDIYSFQSEFEKLYVKTTPKKMLPDLLKYNHLAEPALSLVKSLDDIDDMWLRLKKAYGDPKVMLNKKLAEVRKLGPL